MTYETHTARAALAHAIEEAIDLLDLVDGDPDFEPSLGSYDGGLDRYDLEGDDADREPSLGALQGIRQDGDRWAGAGHVGYGLTDLEKDDADKEDNGDTEPNGDEMDFSDHPHGMDGGIGDLDGLAEQAGDYEGPAVRRQSYADWLAGKAAAAAAVGRLRTIVLRSRASVASQRGNLCPAVRP